MEIQSILVGLESPKIMPKKEKKMLKMRNSRLQTRPLSFHVLIVHHIALELKPLQLAPFESIVTITKGVLPVRKKWATFPLWNFHVFITFLYPVPCFSFDFFHTQFKQRTAKIVLWNKSFCSLKLIWRVCHSWWLFENLIYSGETAGLAVYSIVKYLILIS